MQIFLFSPFKIIRSLLDNKVLIYNLSRREVIGRYKGSFLGVFLSFINPVFMLSVYTYIFSSVFKSKWSGASGSKFEFALILFAGLIVFNLFAECFNRAPSLIISNSNYVKKIIFPLEIFPWVSIGSAIFHSAISLLVWVIFYAVVSGMPNITILLFPIVILPLVFFTLGISWLLASLGVYARDMNQLVTILTTVLMFMTPIFYPIDAIPENYRWLVRLNPLAYVVEQSRNVLYWGKVPDWYQLSGYILASLIVAWLGFVWFQKTRKGFADVI